MPLSCRSKRRFLGVFLQESIFRPNGQLSPWACSTYMEAMTLSYDLAYLETVLASCVFARLVLLTQCNRIEHKIWHLVVGKHRTARAAKMVSVEKYWTCPILKMPIVTTVTTFHLVCALTRAPSESLDCGLLAVEGARHSAPSLVLMKLRAPWRIFCK